MFGCEMSPEEKQTQSRQLAGSRARVLYELQTDGANEQLFTLYCRDDQVLLYHVNPVGRTAVHELWSPCPPEHAQAGAHP